MPLRASLGRFRPWPWALFGHPPPGNPAPDAAHPPLSRSGPGGCDRLRIRRPQVRILLGPPVFRYLRSTGPASPHSVGPAWAPPRPSGRSEGMPDRRWEGGYIRQDKRGRDVYVIRRKVRGRAYKVSTRCHTARSALEHLARFEADPQLRPARAGALRPDRPRRALPRASSGGRARRRRTPEVGRRAEVAALKWWRPTCAAAISRSLPGRGHHPGAGRLARCAEEDARARPQDRHAQGALRLAAARAAPPQLHRGPDRRPRRAAVQAGAAADAEGAHPRAGAAGGGGARPAPPAGPARGGARGRAGPGAAHDRLPPPPAPRASTGWHVTELARFASAGRILDPDRDAGADGTAADARDDAQERRSLPHPRRARWARRPRASCARWAGSRSSGTPRR
jgi:hypothetical protein